MNQGLTTIEDHAFDVYDSIQMWNIVGYIEEIDIDIALRVPEAGGYLKLILLRV